MRKNELQCKARTSIPAGARSARTARTSSRDGASPSGFLIVAIMRRRVAPIGKIATGPSSLGHSCSWSAGRASFVSTSARVGSRVAGRLASDWYAVYVETPREEPGRIDPHDHAVLQQNI